MAVGDIFRSDQVGGGGQIAVVEIETSDGKRAYAYATASEGGSGGSTTTEWSAADAARIGNVTETAPATDTASSGLNGRLQRLAQRLTSLIALLPASLGAKTAATSLSIVPATDAAFTTRAASATWVSHSGTIAAAGVSQALIPANAARRGFFIQNDSAGDLWFMDGAAATQAQPSVRLQPGDYYETPEGGCPATAINIIGATTGQAFSSREW